MPRFKDIGRNVLPIALGGMAGGLGGAARVAGPAILNALRKRKRRLTPATGNFPQGKQPITTPKTMPASPAPLLQKKPTPRRFVI